MIKQPWLFWVSAVLLVVVLGFVIERTLFLQTAARTTGEVIGLSSSNGRCGGGRHRASYSCTRFQAQITFSAPPHGSYTFSVGAGSTRGHDRSVQFANYRQGQSVGVVFSPKNPNKAYVDTLFGVWGAPLAMAFFQLMTFISSLFPGKRSRYY